MKNNKPTKEFIRYPTSWEESNQNPDNRILGEDFKWDKIVKQEEIKNGNRTDKH